MCGWNAYHTIFSSEEHLFLCSRRVAFNFAILMHFYNQKNALTNRA